MNKKNVICIVGRTGSGKDYIANHLSRKLNIPMVVSYTTREKRSNETNGKEHWFITKDDAIDMLKDEDILAYTEIGDILYFATLSSIDTISSIYIIDPNGVEFLKNKFSDKLNIKVVYVYADEDVRDRRASHRSDYDSAFKKRNNAEDKQFNRFEELHSWDLLIDNSNDISIDKICKDIWMLTK